MAQAANIIIFLLLFSAIVYIFYVVLQGYGKGRIVIDLDQRYRDYKAYMQAIKLELEEQGREVSYIGNQEFIIDGKTYVFIERNVVMGGAPLQKTILKPKRDKSRNE